MTARITRTARSRIIHIVSLFQNTACRSAAMDLACEIVKKVSCNKRDFWVLHCKAKSQERKQDVLMPQLQIGVSVGCSASARFENPKKDA